MNHRKTYRLTERGRYLLELLVLMIAIGIAWLLICLLATTVLL